MGHHIGGPGGADDVDCEPCGVASVVKKVEAEDGVAFEELGDVGVRDGTFGELERHVVWVEIVRGGACRFVASAPVAWMWICVLVSWGRG